MFVHEQTRFAVLNAAFYGVPQSRKRLFIWAAAPGAPLPQWPRPRHAFFMDHMTLNLPGGVKYTAIPAWARDGAPLRAVTVRDAIGDLPHIEDGHDV
jgi:DNA (cytosine-5)-methyltransferase 1